MRMSGPGFYSRWLVLLLLLLPLPQVLAVSDLVIYRSRAERLHNDLFYFLGDAAKAYNAHFQVGSFSSCSSSQFPPTPQAELSKLGEGALGPAVILFQVCAF